MRALIANAVDLPVIGDLEKGFGDSPDDAAETIRQAAGVGLVGGSIEDATGNQDAAAVRYRHGDDAHQGGGRGGARRCRSRSC